MNTTYTITITIQFLDYWHTGSGESGGNESDARVIRYERGEKKGLPFVPGKTIKGLVREMVEAQGVSCEELHLWFGNTSEAKDTSGKKNPCYKIDKVDETPTHMSNGDIIEDIKAENIPFLFKTFKNTKLTKGIAEEGTLREIETVIPVTVVAEFSGIEADANQLELLKKAIMSIKRIGLNRNRGMGRCEVRVESTEEVAS
jgi:CRISPR/Cas system CSM-associated protein Csm3 (group 7 of RAMP superfamily)